MEFYFVPSSVRKSVWLWSASCGVRIGSPQSTGNSIQLMLARSLCSTAGQPQPRVLPIYRTEPSVAASFLRASSTDMNLPSRKTPVFPSRLRNSNQRSSTFSSCLTCRPEISVVRKSTTPSAPKSRPCGRQHDDDLHARPESRRVGRQEPCRPVVAARAAAVGCGRTHITAFNAGSADALYLRTCQLVVLTSGDVTESRLAARRLHITAPSTANRICTREQCQDANIKHESGLAATRAGVVDPRLAAGGASGLLHRQLDGRRSLLNVTTEPRRHHRYPAADFCR